MRIAAAALVVVLGLLAVAVAGAVPAQQRGPVQEIIRSPARFYGERVRFDAQVSTQIDHRVWEMANGRLFLIKDEPVKPAPGAGEVLRIWGTVRPSRRG